MSSIYNVKTAVQWRHPNDRNGCLNCQHGQHGQHGHAVPQGAGFCWNCGKHGFYTHRHAICKAWEERKVGAA